VRVTVHIDFSVTWLKNSTGLVLAHTK